MEMTESSCNLKHRFVGKVQQKFHSAEEKLIWIPVIRIFQALRKKNDDFRGYFHRKINRWDSATNLLPLLEELGAYLEGHLAQSGDVSRIYSCLF